MGVLDSFRLDGRRALVTGGSRGLGKAIGLALAEAGANVTVVSRTAFECETAAREIAARTSRRTAWLSADVTVSTEIDRLADDVGPLDILVNNAGFNRRRPVAELTEEDWDLAISTNLKAPFLLARAFGPGMAERGWGRIVNIGSVLSHVGIAQRASTASAKAGLLGLTRVLALEWAEAGVTVNAVCPGPIAMTEEAEKPKAFVERIPMGRFADPGEVAAAVVFLASEAAAYVTGTALCIDGGWTAQ